MRAIRYEALQQHFPGPLLPPDPWPYGDLFEGLRAWARKCPGPVVLFFDDADALHGKTMLSVLAQLRAGIEARPGSFPASVAVCGVRDIFGGAQESAWAGNFTRSEIEELYGQHTAETGLSFAPAAVNRAYEYAQGQPWLVNALGASIVNAVDDPETESPVTVAGVGETKERLVQAWACHLDSLASVLNEPRVRRIIEPMIGGTFRDAGSREFRDLGLITPTNPVRIANPIYREILSSALSDRLNSQTPF